MRALMDGFCAAFSLYSVLPVPQPRWDREGVRYALCFFPLVGAFPAALIAGWGLLAARLGLSALLFGVVAALLPVAVSGGIHMDGFMDTMDAIGSHAPSEKRLEILRDPRAGAFAVLGCAGYLLLSCAMWAQLFGKPRWVLFAVAGTVTSRALDGLSIAVLPPARDSGLVHLFSSGASRKAAVSACVLFALLGLGAAVYLSPVAGVALAVLCVLLLLWHRRVVMRSFGGNTGDLAGFLLQNVELLFLVVAVAGEVTA